MENDAPHEHPDSDNGLEDTTKDFLINSCLKSMVDPSMSSMLSLSVTKQLFCLSIERRLSLHSVVFWQRR